MVKPITPGARTRLQILYGQYAARSFDVGTSREDRMAWATEVLGREVESFSKLSADEGKQLIDHLQAILGIEQTLPPKRRRMSKRNAQKHGTEGRRDQLHDETTMVDGTEQLFRKIQGQMTLLGMDNDGLKRFLRSTHGPNNGRDTIRTLGEANRVWWALKRQVSYQEKTRKRGAAA